jgi:type IV secretion system protein TrbJ
MSRRKFFKNALGLVVVASFPLASTNVFAWNGVASEWTQLANMMVLLKSYVAQAKNVTNQIMQIKTMVNQYTIMAKNYLNVPNDIWNSFAKDVAGVVNVYKQSRSLMNKFSGIDNQMKGVYKNYEFFRAKKMGMKDYFIQYSDWHKVNTELMQDMFAKVGLSSDKINSSEDQIARLIELNRRSTGHQQTMQVANEFLGTLGKQVGNLENIMLSQLQLQTQFQAQREQEIAAQRAEEEKMNSGIGKIIIGNGVNDSKMLFK